MAKKKPQIINKPAAVVQDQRIYDTVEKNYMPYVMTVIKSRAIPEIDGFKPSHRKLLYTMFKMGLLQGSGRTKSANVVGQTMKLNPHGEGAIYETLVRLTKGNEALLHPFIDSKGSFGKQYSRDMAYAASRYTECKLDSFCAEIFSGIDKDAVDFSDNYDGTMKEPALLPVTFPNVLVSPNVGIAVGMASNICSFNLSEVCEGAIEVIKNPDITVEQLMNYIKAPDFSTGGQLIYDAKKIAEIYQTGRGSVKVRARWSYDASQNCIEVHQIPYTATIESIMDRMESGIKDGRIREVSDVRDETDLSGLKIAIDVKRGIQPEKLMAKLFKMTPLEEDFPCNFNILISGTPRVMGVKEVLEEWAAFRLECIKRELYYTLQKQKDKLHLLEGLKKILLDIDKAIRIIRETPKEALVVANLMKGFDIDEIQAEYIADIRLRHINSEYILERIKETSALEREIEELQDTLGNRKKLGNIIIKQLGDIKKKHGKPRMTQIIYDGDQEVYDPSEEEIEDYPVYVVASRDGYFKKITMQSLRGNDEQKFKEGDSLAYSAETSNRAEVLFFTDKAQVYKVRVSELENVKASVLGDFMPAKLSFDEGEKVAVT